MEKERTIARGDKTVKGTIVKMDDGSSIKPCIEVLMQPSKGGLLIVKLRTGDTVQIVPQGRPRKKSSKKRDTAL